MSLRNAPQYRVYRHRRNFAWVCWYLNHHPCVDCAERDWVVLEFDHQGEKELNIGANLWNMSLKRLQAEVVKCEVRCCNCHRRRHSTRTETVQKYGLSTDAVDEPRPAPRRPTRRASPSRKRSTSKLLSSRYYRAQTDANFAQS